MTDNLELREKARRYLQHKNLDGLLAGLYFHLNNSPYWSEKKNAGEATLALGLTNVLETSKTVTVKDEQKNLVFTCANFKGINFQYGCYFGESHTSRKYGCVFLFIDDKLIVNFSFSGSEGYLCWDDFRFEEMIELHTTPKLEELVFGMLNEKETNRQKQFEKDKQRENQKYEGRFSFEDGTSNETKDSLPTENAAYKLGKLFGKFFK
jgi:hypothetical protein